MDINTVKLQAQKELDEEDFRHEVDKMKRNLRDRRTIWDRIFPFKIMIVRKGV